MQRRGIARGLRAAVSKPQRIEGPSGCRRASVAAIFRKSEAGEEQILFIRRALNPKDHWSGHVALPGGRQDPEDHDDDELTAMRETFEEVGLQLTGWSRLGRLANDRVIYARGRPMVVSVFGFEEDADDVDRSRPLLQPQQTEIADAWWVDTRLLAPERLGRRELQLEQTVGRKLWATPLLKLIGCAKIRIATIDLPRPYTCGDVPQNPNDEDVTKFQLWGLTLGILSDVCRNAHGSPLVGHGAPRGFDRPYLATGGPFGQLMLELILAIPMLSAKLRSGRVRSAIQACSLSALIIATGVVAFVLPRPLPLDRIVQ